MAVDPDPRDLCSLERVKRLLKEDPDTTTDDDDALRELISDVSDRILRDTGREFVSADADWTDPDDKTFGAITVPATERLFIANGTPEIQIGDLHEVASATINGADVDISGWQLLPYGYPTRRIGFSLALAYTGGSVALFGSMFYGYTGDGRVTYRAGVPIAITAKWGMATIPRAIQGAAAKQVAIEAERHLETFSQTFNLNENRVDIPRGYGSAVWDVLDGWRDLGAGVI